MSNKEGDLHTKKDSHISIPISKNVEWHLTGKDTKEGVKEGDHGVMVTPVRATSVDKDGGMPHQRFKQVSKTYIGDQSKKPALRGVTHQGD